MFKTLNASGIITPVAAQDTGLVPTGWEVESDSLEGDVNLANLDYSFCPVREGEPYINGDILFRRAHEVSAFGSLGFAAQLQKAQDEGEEIFPIKSRDKHYFIMPRTVLLDGRRRRRVACFGWRERSRRWGSYFVWLACDSYLGLIRDDARLVRSRV